MVLRFLVLTFVCCYVQSNAQINHPKASPFSVVEQEVGLSKITAEYSRPAVRDRHIFGNRSDGQPGLVPYGRIWRVGANESTKITVNADMKIMGNTLPKGTYALYAFPEPGRWEIAFHTNTTHWGDGRKNYNPNEDLFRISVKPQKTPCHQENFLITFDSITHNKAEMRLIWADTMVTIPFETDTHFLMKMEIAKQISENPSPQTYYEAARYLQEQGVDYRIALTYLNKALEMGGDTYYFYRVKSLVEAALGEYTAAIASAKRSLKIANELGKDEFVRMNQKNVDKWEKQLK
ncbi:DUF2911 domain-containing protein [Flagellimonas sp. S3867]|uniref:DUF2911 domain-containing protein n=1 Tax=Flagellimonas sp. S3867 TaxID=2768063 RepID=UPI0016828783|nr:DUF2911 domain-containing protein [Flagellimonas sp. S3867]